MIPPPRTQQSEWLNHITMRCADEFRVNVWLIRLAVAATKEVRLRDFTCQDWSDFRDPKAPKTLPSRTGNFLERTGNFPSVSGNAA